MSSTRYIHQRVKAKYESAIQMRESRIQSVQSLVSETEDRAALLESELSRLNDDKLDEVFFTVI